MEHLKKKFSHACLPWEEHNIINKLNYMITLCNVLWDYIILVFAVDSVTSSSHSINVGVPQGSLWHPTLFLLHINDLPSCAPIYYYANDRTVYDEFLIAFKGKRDTPESENFDDKADELPGESFLTIVFPQVHYTLILLYNIFKNWFLFKVSTAGNYVCPLFNKYLELKDSIHPMLDYVIPASSIPNDVVRLKYSN